MTLPYPLGSSGRGLLRAVSDRARAPAAFVSKRVSATLADGGTQELSAPLSYSRELWLIPRDEPSITASPPAHVSVRTGAPAHTAQWVDRIAAGAVHRGAGRDGVGARRRWGGKVTARKNPVQRQADPAVLASVMALVDTKLGRRPLVLSLRCSDPRSNEGARPATGSMFSNAIAPLCRATNSRSTCKQTSLAPVWPMRVR